MARPLPQVVEVQDQVPRIPAQEQWGHRTPYIYIPSENKLYWGHPGTSHGRLAWNISTQHGVPVGTRDAWYGSIYHHPTDPGLVAHSIHRWRLDRDPETEAQLESVTGIPIDPHVGPEWLQDDFGPEDWYQRIPQRVAANPKDWKTRYNYHAPVGGEKHCGNCAAFKNGRCEMFNDQVYASYVCSEWTDDWKGSEGH